MHRVERVFAWLGGILFILVCLAVVAVFVFRATVVGNLTRELFVTRSAATATPETFGVPYRSVKLDSHGRNLQAWTVDAGPNAPAILLFHGNAETIHDFARVQAYLFHHHVSSMSFDYSGFGASTGKPSIRNLNEDAYVAWRTFVSWAGPDRAKFVLGYSLGSGVALQNVAGFDPQPLGVIVYGAFSSVRNLIPYISGGGFPGWLKPLLPNVWDNVGNATTLREPLLVVAGMNDTNVPPEMGRQVALFAAAANQGGDFVLIPNAGHSGIMTEQAVVWPPILAFVRKLAKIAPAPAAASSATRPATAPSAIPAPISTVGWLRGQSGQ